MTMFWEKLMQNLKFVTSFKTCFACGIAFLALSSQSVVAQEIPPPSANSSLNQMMNCSNVADNGQRLACFDSHAATIKTQLGNGELVPVYKAEIAEARRGLFGIDRIRMPDFLNNENEDISEISTTITSASRAPGGAWRFVLADGSQWDQIDTANPYFSSREGTPVRVRRATLGSYLLTVGNSSAMRVSRKR